MPAQGDSATRRTQTYYATETLDSRGRPVTPDNPEWRLYSSVVRTTEPGPGKEFGQRQGLGHLDNHDKTQAQESHEHTVEYELERFPVDSNGNPVDPFGDATVVSADNAVGTTHSFYQRVVQADVRAENTVHAKWFDRDDVQASDHPTGAVPDAEARKRRQVIYGRGGMPSEPVLGVNADDAPIATVEFAYQFRMMRSYGFNKPQNGYLHVASTDAADTGLEVTIENEDATATETVTLDGSDATTAVATTTQFDSIERVYVPGRNEGTVMVFDDDGSGTDAAGAANQLVARIKGAELYDGIQSDDGVPPLGDGSFDDGSTLEGKQYAIGAELYWCGEPIADYHQGTSLTLAYDLGEQSATDTGFAIPRQAGLREVNAEVTAFGETASHDHFSDFVEGREGVLELRLTDGNITLPKASINEGGPGAREEGSAFILPEVTFRGYEDIDAGREAIEMTRA